ncbi:MAG TPA: hypothetical protein VGD57_09110 [Candidatus Dormibacteraeota bacterium]|jgi:hypothetical protein
MISTDQPQSSVAPALGREISRAGWVAKYRSQVPSADRWAHGLPQRAHSIETQERVFRMAQQLADKGIGRQQLFTSLEEADRSVATAIDPESVAEAGSRAIGSLLTLDSRTIVISSEGDGPDIRAFGFDPITFDGHDPAAHAWARFELTMRARESDQHACSCHPLSVPSAVGLALL